MTLVAGLHVTLVTACDSRHWVIWHHCNRLCNFHYDSQNNSDRFNGFSVVTGTKACWTYLKYFATHSVYRYSRVASCKIASGQVLLFQRFSSILVLWTLEILSGRQLLRKSKYHQCLVTPICKIIEGCETVLNGCKYQLTTRKPLKNTWNQLSVILASHSSLPPSESFIWPPDLQAYCHVPVLVYFAPCVLRNYSFTNFLPKRELSQEHFC